MMGKAPNSNSRLLQGGPEVSLEAETKTALRSKQSANSEAHLGVTNSEPPDQTYQKIQGKVQRSKRRKEKQGDEEGGGSEEPVWEGHVPKEATELPMIL